MSTPTLHFTRFGRFEILKKLGRSMSDVYLAHDPLLQRQVVLKIVEQSHDSFTRAIMDAERRGAAIQQQAHAIDSRILEIFDVGEVDGSFFVAMQHAEGKSLAEVIREEGRLAPFQAARYAAEICSQLASLHSFEAEIDGRNRAVVHGDIKPSNIQIGVDGEVRLLDFGIAKAISATRKLTHHDLGSPAYCSPERLHNSQVDPQADLWATGVCLYEMVSGLPPYQAQTTRKLENVIQSGRPPRALPADCPTALRAIIEKALAAEPLWRYRSAADMEADLRAFLDRAQTAAEADHERRWVANATVEKAEPVSRREKLPFRRHYDAAFATLRSVRGSVLAGVFAGFFLFVPTVQVARFWSASEPLRNEREYRHATVREIERDVYLYSRLEKDHRWLRGLSPAPPLGEKLRARLVAAASSMLAEYRAQAGARLNGFDWAKARLCLQHALKLSPEDPGIQGKLALAEGYEVLANGTADGDTVRRKFEKASLLLAREPDPHLALARTHIYHGRNLGLAVAAWHTAERLGYQLGPREWEQEGDAYLSRVEAAYRDLRAASSREDQARIYSLLQRDVSRARSRYEPILGFGNVSQNLDRLNRLERVARSLQEERSNRAPVRSRRARSRGWR